MNNSRPSAPLRAHLLGLLALLVVAPGCGSQDGPAFARRLTAAAVPPASQGPTPLTASSSGLPAPVVTPAQVAAGEAFRVQCPRPPTARGPDAPAVTFAPQQEAALEGSGLVLPAKLHDTPQGETYLAQGAGNLLVRCSDALQGTTSAAVLLAVHAGPATRVTVQLTKDHTAAGAPVVARCMGLDAAGNLVSPPRAQHTVAAQQPIAAVATGVTLTGAKFQLSAPLKMEALDGHSLRLTGEVAQDVGIRCSVAGWNELAASPTALLQVVPGPISQVRTEVPPGPYSTDAKVSVRCLGFDAYGNPVPDAPFRLEVQAQDAAPAAETAELLWADEQGFRVQRSGRYRTRCLLAALAVPAEGTPDPFNGRPEQGQAEPVVVDVQPGTPVRWEATLFHQGRCFTHNARLPLRWMAWDAAGNAIPDLPVVLETVPKTHVTRDASGGFVFHEEGRFHVTLRPQGAFAAQLKPATFEQQVTIDSTPPDLQILSPARGAMVQSPNAVQTIVGMVRDPATAIVRLTVNGVDQPLPQDAHQHEFRVDVPSPWGLSIVQATAEDRCGNVAILKHSFVRSGAFGPATAEANEAARVASGARAAAAQPVWDDGDPTGGHDISTLLQRALQGGAADQQLPEHLAALSFWNMGLKTQLEERAYDCLGWASKGPESGIEVIRNGPLQMGGPTIEFLHVEEGGVHVALNFHDLRLPVVASLHAGMICGPNVELPTMRATLAVDQLRIEVRGQVNVKDGQVSVALCPECVDATFAGSPPDMLFDDPQVPGKAGFFGSTHLANWTLHKLEGALKRSLQNRIREDVVHEMERLLQNLHIDHSLPLPAPLKTQANVLSGVDNITLRGGEHGGGTSEISLYTQVVAPIRMGADGDLAGRVPVPLPPLRGPIRQDAGGLLPLELSRSDSFAISVRDDMLNQMMWSLWASGMFNEMEPRAFVSTDPGREGNFLDAASLKLFFTSPPLIMPSDRPNEVRLGVGDVYAEAEVDTYAMSGLVAPAGSVPLRARFYFSMVVRASLGVDNLHRTLHMEQVGRPEIELQLVGGGSPATRFAVNGKMQKFLSDFIFSFLSQPLRTFPLPILQIGRLPGIPPDAAWWLEEADIERPAGAQEFIVRGRLGALPDAIERAQRPTG